MASLPTSPSSDEEKETVELAVLTKNDSYKSTTSEEDGKASDKAHVPAAADPLAVESPLPVYRLYKRRWAGLAGLSIINIVLGMNGVWFAAIFDQTRTYFDITTAQFNWLTNAMNVFVIVFGFFVPYIIQRVGVKYTCWLGALASFFGVWLRVAATANPTKGYPLLVLGHCFLGMGTPLVGTIGPKWVELFFNEKGRTTATAIYSMAIIFGSLLGQILSPAFVVNASDMRFGLLVNSGISTVLGLTCFLVFSAPPTPPTFTASTKSLPFFPVLKMICGFGGPISSEAGVDGEVVGRESMSRRERFDFYIIAFCWTMVASALLSVESFIGQITLPYGYDSTTAGFMGAAIIAAGIVFTLAAAPLFDRVLVSHLAIALKSGATAVFFCFVGLVFAVKRGNDGGLYGLFCVMGICGFSLSPLALELGSELTRNPEATTMLLTVLAAIWSIVSTEVIGALAAPDGSLRNGLVYMACMTGVAAAFSWFLKGTQRRRETDVKKKLET
ncbi:major facilitator superfamily domain-containing protein [Mrakia frigida]|uniref:major facilitator superfamily domain-containing protein n=1 Tax=Mrakia frigida TaxID=29902 RepID=UPI003FCBFD32